MSSVNVKLRNSAKKIQKGGEGRRILICPFEILDHTNPNIVTYFLGYIHQQFDNSLKSSPPVTVQETQTAQKSQQIDPREKAVIEIIKAELHSAIEDPEKQFLTTTKVSLQSTQSSASGMQDIQVILGTEDTYSFGMIKEILKEWIIEIQGEDETQPVTFRKGEYYLYTGIRYSIEKLVENQEYVTNGIPADIVIWNLLNICNLLNPDEITTKQIIEKLGNNRVKKLDPNETDTTTTTDPVTIIPQGIASELQSANQQQKKQVANQRQANLQGTDQGQGANTAQGQGADQGQVVLVRGEAETKEEEEEAETKVGGGSKKAKTSKNPPKKSSKKTSKKSSKKSTSVSKQVGGAGTKKSSKKATKKVSKKVSKKNSKKNSKSNKLVGGASKKASKKSSKKTKQASKTNKKKTSKKSAK